MIIKVGDIVAAHKVNKKTDGTKITLSFDIAEPMENIRIFAKNSINISDGDTVKIEKIIAVKRSINRSEKTKQTYINNSIYAEVSVFNAYKEQETDTTEIFEPTSEIINGYEIGVD